MGQLERALPAGGRGSGCGGSGKRSSSRPASAGYDVDVTHNRRDPYDRGQLVIGIGPGPVPGDLTTPLTLHLPDPRPGRRRHGDRWADRSGRRLESMLGEVFTRIEQQADARVADRAEQRRREEEQRLRQQRADDAAAQQRAEEHRRTVLTERIAAARFTEDCRAYAHALDAAAARLDPDQAARDGQWAQWARSYADRTDPRRSLAGMPAAPAPTRADLRGFPSP